METTFSSKQVAAETGLSVHTLRYYEQLGLIQGVQRDHNGYRQYTESDIKWFQVIRHFRDLGLPIKDMQQFHAMPKNIPGSATARREFMEAYRINVVEQLAELQRTLQRVDNKIEFFKNLERKEQLLSSSSSVRE
ncbi:MerR family transcriptional regulator [Paenibacillus campi]|uniref:MerR family transcriptional regulator n=1 Tax=Paenibacillus campi TaxID=3106031 RepID=UPI002AFF2F0E|nr:MULTISPECIES: MerR family transcriptional regulator [unclassified Paenibacillus]